MSAIARTCPLCTLMRRAPALAFRIYDRIDDVDARGWDAIVASQSLALQRRYLRALEGGGSGLRYATFTLEGQIVGVARFHEAAFEGPRFGSLLDRGARVLAVLADWLGLARRELRSDVVVCGSDLASGERGFAFAPDVPPDVAMRGLADAAEHVRRISGRDGGAAAVLFQDMSSASAPGAGLLKEYAYVTVETQPAMVLPIDPSWQSFEDYLQSLSSKYRVKAKRAYAKSSRLVEVDLGPDDLTRESARVGALYDAVLSNAQFRLDRFDVGGLRALREALGDELVIRGYRLDGELVGFLTALHHDGALSAGIVGFDYARNREHSIYPRMLYDYARLGLERRCTKVAFGRTASEIKSTVGAIPIPTSCLVKHRSGVVNGALPSIVARIPTETFNQRMPFKKAWYAMHGVGFARQLGASAGAMG